MRYEVRVDIAAGEDVVWAVLVDVERWPEWTSSIRRVQRLDEGSFDVGSRVRIVQPMLPPAVWRVTTFAPGRGFAWTSRATGLTTVADHRIAAASDGVVVTLSIAQDGPLAGLFGALSGRLTRRYVDTEARGLKARCESAAAGPAGANADG
jgi:uncharacterized membrane protein